jgi:hypothetical protein
MPLHKQKCENIKLLNIIMSSNDKLIKSVFNTTDITNQYDLLKFIVNNNQQLIDYLITKYSTNMLTSVDNKDNVSAASTVVCEYGDNDNNDNVSVASTVVCEYDDNIDSLVKLKNKISVPLGRLTNYDDIKAGQIIMLQGSRYSGKTTIIKDLLRHLYNTKQLDECVIFTGNNHNYDDYHEITNVIYNYEINTALLEQILYTQKQHQQNGKKNNVVIVLEEYFCTTKNKLFWKSDIAQTLFDCKKYDITLILSSQYCYNIFPNLESRIDHSFVGRCHYRSFIPSYYKLCCSDTLLSYSELDIILHNIKFHEFLVISNDKTNKSKTLNLFMSPDSISNFTISIPSMEFIQPSTE